MRQPSATTVVSLLPPFLLFATASVQIVHSRLTGTLSAWRGGGFGMFSTLDSPSNRYLHIHLFDGQAVHCVPAPRSAAAEAAAVTQEPTAKRLRKLADHLMPVRWMLRTDPSGAVSVFALEERHLPADSHPFVASKIELQVWKGEFDAASHKYRSVLAGSLAIGEEELDDASSRPR